MGNNCSCSKNNDTVEYIPMRCCRRFYDIEQPPDIVECSIIDNEE
jgi:hypothetical protein